MSDSEQALRTQLDAALETIRALSKRMHQLENGDVQSPLQRQLKSYQQHIEEKSIALENVTNWFDIIEQNSMDAIVRIDQQGCIQSWNPMAERMFGYRKDEIIGQRIENTLIPQRLHNRHLRHFYRHLKRGRGILMNRRIEGMAQCKDGSELPVEFVGSVVIHRDNSAFVMVLRDISERKAAEKALRNSHADLESLVEVRTREVRNLAAIIEATINFVGMADLQGHIFYVNPAGREMVGLTQDSSLETLNFENFHSPETCQLLTETIFPQILEQGVFETDCEFIDQDGNAIPTSAVFMTLANDEGEIDHLAVIARDMRKEIALQQQVEHVDRLESLGILAGGIAHDFNNILTAIIGNAGLATRKLDAYSPAQKHLQGIEQSGQQAANLCKQMLAYSGKDTREVQPVDLNHLIIDMEPLLEVSMGKNVLLKLHLSETLPLIDADITQIQQIILNLVINASEAIDKGNGTINITTNTIQVDEQYLQNTLHKKDISAGIFVSLKVSDTGCGMDADTRKKIFDPFFTTKFTGRGLGMSAVLGIIHGHHGILNIDSEPGRGTTFNIALPVSASKEITTVDQNNTSADHSVSGTVLVVDDEESIREIASMILEEMGYTVLLAEDGENGVEIFRQHHQEIVGIILDMTMPRMSGSECFLELRKISPSAQIILSSGYSQQDVSTHFQDKGLAGFIQKPYQIEHFQSVVAECFNPEKA